MDALEKINWSKFKAKAIDKDDKNEVRTRFQKDRDRILYSKAFRRLSSKTQIFITGYDDHLRTRLTHTIEVAQIARTICEYLNLDSYLTEAIALGHDIGHAPFGHVGEKVINLFTNGCEVYKSFNARSGTGAVAADILHTEFRGFKHNWQAVRILTHLEHYKGNTGLNITNEVLYGILVHTKLEHHDPNDIADKCNLLVPILDAEGQPNREYCKLNQSTFLDQCSTPKHIVEFYKSRYGTIDNINNFTFEAMIVAVADEIAQRHHDVEDGLRFNTILKDDLAKKLKKIHLDISGISKVDEQAYISSISSMIVDFYVTKTIKYFQEYFQSVDSEFGSLKNVRKSMDTSTLINKFSIDNVVKRDSEVKQFLKDRILLSHEAQVMDGRAYYMIRKLFRAYISNPQQLPNDTIKTFFEFYDQYNIDNSPLKLNTALSKYRVDKSNPRSYLDEAHKTGNYVYKGIMLRTISDYISGMTDRKANEEFRRLYGVDEDILIK